MMPLERGKKKKSVSVRHFRFLICLENGGWGVGGKLKSKNIRIEEALAEIPHADLIKIMETETARYRVEQLRIGHGNGDNLRDIELEEVDIAQDGDVVRVADEHEDQERQRDEVQQAGYDGGVAASLGCCGGGGGSHVVD